MPQLQIPERLVRLATTPKRFKVIVGGRGGAKSEAVAAIMAAGVSMHGHTVLGAREMMNSISDSVHATMSSQIDRYQMSGFDVLESKIQHQNGGQVIYRGLARNPEGLKSLYGIDRAWVEEAQTISEASIKMLTPSIRAPGSEIWLTGNPRSSKDPFSKRFLKPWEGTLKSQGWYEDDLHLVIFVNYLDNPWFPPELEAERRYDYEHKDRATYNHIWLGHYDDTIDAAIIKPEWFDACVDAHVKLNFEPRGVEVVSHDPSDEGSDAKGLAYRRGVVFYDICENDQGDINEGGDWAADKAVEHRADVFIWDGDGMGVGLRRQFSSSFDGKRISTAMFRGSAGPDNPDMIYEDPLDKQSDKLDANVKTNRETFKNKRAQYYWEVRERMRRTYYAVEKGVYTDPDSLISFSSKIKQLDLLRAEICRIPRKPNGTGLIQILSKDEMRSRGISSPHMSDSVMMSWAVPMADAGWGKAPKIDTSWVT